MTYLLDTDVISEFRKRHPEAHVLGWYETVTSAEMFISALTIGETRLGIERLRRGDHAARTSGGAASSPGWLAP